MSNPEWYRAIPEDYDFSCIFFFDTWEDSYTMWSCDEEVEMANEGSFDEETAPWTVSDTISCWFHDEPAACYYENRGECLSFDEALEWYFGEYEEEVDEEIEEEEDVAIGDFEWDEDFEVPDSDWYNEFADEVDLGIFFPEGYVDDYGTSWSCDYDDWCIYYDEPLDEYCDNDGDCYTFDESVQYFYGEWIHWEEQGLAAWEQTGQTNWGKNLGWCMSDLDAHVGYFNDIEECWGACTHVFGDVVYSVDFWANEGEKGDCYCQHDCFCMESIDSDIVETMTLDSLAALPEACDGQEEVDEEIYEEYDCENWEDQFDMSNPEWYLDLTEDFDFICIFKYESPDENGNTWACDEDVYDDGTVMC
jgi:hypothetical protein